MIATIPTASSGAGAPFPVRRDNRHGAHTNANAAPINNADARVSVPSYTRDGSV